MTTPPISLLTDIVRVAVACLRSEGKVQFFAIRILVLTCHVHDCRSVRMLQNLCTIYIDIEGQCNQPAVSNKHVTRNFDALVLSGVFRYAVNISLEKWERSA